MEVIVIGSGPAGLAALRRLHEAGVAAVCLEAADRIGGRVNSVPFAGHVVDLGAQECEGVKHNIVVEMAKPFNLLENLKEPERYTILSNGDMLPHNTVGEFVKNADALIAAADMETKSVARLLDDFSKSEHVNDKSLNRSLLEWYKRSHELGGEADEEFGKSLKGVRSKPPFQFKNQTWKGKGMGMILEIIMNKYPDKSKALPLSIHMKKEVDKVSWKNESKLVKVTCKNGSVYEARSIISTVSIGVLKERQNLFEPKLPREKMDAINSLDMFVLDKIFMEFSEPWWPQTPAHFDIIWLEEDKATFSGDHKWITEVYGLDTVDGNPNVLVGWINDEGARMMERTSEDDVKNGMDRLLCRLFKKQFDVMPIKSLLRTKWATNRFERGAYSYRSERSEANNFSAEMLTKPIEDDNGFPVICFAGEATSDHQATVHGAIETGLREADRLIALKQC